MNALDAGLLCTLLLIGTVAALLGGMSAARRRRRASFALCLAAAAPDFALLSVLLAACRIAKRLRMRRSGRPPC